MSIDGVHPDVIDELDAELGADLRAARDAAPLPVLGAALARVFEEGLPPVSAPAPAAGTRRRAVRRGAVVAGVAGLFAGGLGVAGALPAPVQRAVSEVADVIGVQLPSPADDDADPPAGDTDPPADAPVIVPPTMVGRTTPTIPPRPTSPGAVSPPAVDRGQGADPSQVRDQDKGRDKDKDVEKAPSPEAEEPEVELEQRSPGGGGKANGRADDIDAVGDEPVPATRGSEKGRAEDVVDELLDVVEERKPEA